MLYRMQPLALRLGRNTASLMHGVIGARRLGPSWLAPAAMCGVEALVCSNCSGRARATSRRLCHVRREYPDPREGTSSSIRPKSSMKAVGGGRSPNAAEGPRAVHYECLNTLRGFMKHVALNEVPDSGVLELARCTPDRSAPRETRTLLTHCPQHMAANPMNKRRPSVSVSCC